SEIAVAIALRSRLTIAAASSRSDMVGAHELDELLHDRRELEVLRRVHARDAHLLQRFRVGVRNDAAHDDGDLIEPHLAHALEGLADELEVRARENREAHEVNAFVGSGARELGRRRADAVVDDLEARIACAKRDLLGAVRVTVETGLADEHLGTPPDRVLELLDGDAKLRGAVVGTVRLGHARDARDAGGRAVLAEDLAHGVGPLAGRDARMRRRDRRRHDVAAVLRRFDEVLERLANALRIAARTPGRELLLVLALDARIDAQDRARATVGEQGALRRLREAIDADDDLLAALDGRKAPRVRCDEALLDVAAFDA